MLYILSVDRERAKSQRRLGLPGISPVVFRCMRYLSGPLLESNQSNIAVPVIRVNGVQKERRLALPVVNELTSLNAHLTV